MRLLLLALACSLSHAVEYDAVISAAHHRAERNRLTRLERWSQAKLTPVSTNNSSVDCKHFNIQNGMVGVAIAHLYINNNASQVAQANAFFVNLSACLAPGSTGPVGQPLEMSYVSRAFALFHSESPLVAQQQVAPLSSDAEKAMKEMWYRYITQFGAFGKRYTSVWDQFGSENRDTVEQTSCYLAAETLARDPAYANRTVPGNSTVAELAQHWEAFISEWLLTPNLNLNLNLILTQQ